MSIPTKLFITEKVPGDPRIRTLEIDDPTLIHHALYKKVMAQAGQIVADTVVIQHLMSREGAIRKSFACQN